MEDVSRDQLSSAFGALRAALSEDRTIVALLSRVDGDELSIQYATTLDLPPTIELLRDAADAIEDRPLSPLVELN